MGTLRGRDVRNDVRPVLPCRIHLLQSFLHHRCRLNATCPKLVLPIGYQLFYTQSSLPFQPAYSNNHLLFLIVIIGLSVSKTLCSKLFLFTFDGSVKRPFNVVFRVVERTNATDIYQNYETSILLNCAKLTFSCMPSAFKVGTYYYLLRYY